MKTECSTKRVEFHPHFGRLVTGAFDGGTITSDGGGLVLREVEDRVGAMAAMAECFTGHRDPDLIEHSIQSLVSQRVNGLALGYEDLNDHDHLRCDPLLAGAGGQGRRRRDRPGPRARPGQGDGGQEYAEPAGAGHVRGGRDGPL